MSLLEIKNLRKTFCTPRGEISARISIPYLKLEKGEALLLDGPSGSGKTTVLHMISGLLAADCGSISFNGEDVSSMAVAQRDSWRADNVGYIFQRLNLLEELNVLENILLPQCWRKQKNKLDLRKQALKLLQKVLLADEPTASLDLANGRVVLQLIRDLCQENDVALLLSTHDEAVKAQFAHKYDVRSACYE